MIFRGCDDMMKHKIICGKSEIELKQFNDNTFDSCVTDPPYGLDFMGKDWDKFKKGENIAGGTTGLNTPFGRKRALPAFYQLNNTDLHAFQQFTYEWATELYRVLKPGAHILVFGGTRTYHRMACAIEDAGFEVRDMINWMYGSGFPKSLDISKNLDKMKGEEREVVGISYVRNGKDGTNNETFKQAKRETTFITAPTSEEAIQWNGWGTALKPSHEPILLARKPISERNIASNVLKHGTGGLNIDGCRIPFQSDKDIGDSSRFTGLTPYPVDKGWNQNSLVTQGYDVSKGRYPSNLLLECCCECDELVEGCIKSAGWRDEDKINAKSFSFGAESYRGKNYANKNGNEKCLIHTNPNCVCRMLNGQSGESISRKREVSNSAPNSQSMFGIGINDFAHNTEYSDKGGASRFFYQAKASQKERWFYCTICKKAYHMEERDKHIHNAPKKAKYQYLEFHPTQKPEKLIEYLIRLITPPNGTVLDPFLGSGTGLIAAEREGFNCIGIDSKFEYCEIAYQRGKTELIQQKIFAERSTIKKEGF